MHKKFIILFLAVFIFASSFVSAATYYVCDATSACNANSSGWNTGNDANSCTSKAVACKTIKGGIAKMSGGDTLVIGDGVYKGAENMMSRQPGNDETTEIPNGNAGAYTVIKAENYLGAVIDGEDVYNPIYITTRQYMRFENLHLRNSRDTGFVALYSNHIKVIKFASEETRYFHFWFRWSKYCLVEDTFMWGRQAYAIIFGTDGNYADCQYNIARRCVVRRDAHYYATGGNHYSAFVAYWADNNYFQNCISVDANHIDVGPDPDPYDTCAVFYTANGATNYHADGCVSINDVGQIGQFESGATGVLKDNTGILSPTGGKVGLWTYGSLTVENNILSGAKGTEEWEGSGIAEVQGTIKGVKNNIIYNNIDGLVDVSGSHTYNVLYNTFQDYVSTSSGTGEVTNKNPLTNGLLYPVRVEAGSFLSTACENGGRCGPEIMKKIGVSGTLYGEAGWNTLTNENLWPFPYEDVIKEKMRTYNSHGVNGARGFAANGNGLYGGPITLTSYIWEYLGNACPSDICNYNVQYHPADTNQNNIIEMKELIAFIGLWKASQANLSDVLSALDRWMGGS